MCYAGGPRCDDKNLSVEDLRILNEKRLDKATKKIETFKGTPKEDTYRSARARAKAALYGKTKEGTLEESYYEVKEPDGGGTITVDGKTSPVAGFCYSPYPDREQIFESAQDFAPDQETMSKNLVAFFNKNRDVFEGNPQNWIGFWNDPDSGKIYLDVSVVTMSAEKAREDCKKYNQLAYFDLQDYSSVDTKQE